MNRFIFKSYEFDELTQTAHFQYGFEDGEVFEETVTFQVAEKYNTAVLESALFLAFVLIGTSYYKSFPSREVVLDMPLDDSQVAFFNQVYQEGLGQFAYENNLTRQDLAHFKQNGEVVTAQNSYKGTGILALQSGGKDSLLVASLLTAKSQNFTPWYVTSTSTHPRVLDTFAEATITSLRVIDHEGLRAVKTNGGKNGHIPITYIIQSLAVIQAILLGKSDIIVSIAHEGEEPDAHIGDLAVTHQWSKTWGAETAFAEYVNKYISPDIRIGSPLRGYSELRVAELFVEHAWEKYGREFSSCNVANYGQGNDNSTLKWCGNCPKCANSYLLFAPFVPSDELQSLFNNQDLFTKPTLEETFKGLLGIDDVQKPFECIGEIEELRWAYHKAQARGDYKPLPFTVPKSSFDYMQTYPAQPWAVKMLQ